MDVCTRKAPPSVSIGADHIAACWLHVDPAERQASENGVPANGSRIGATQKR
jgi:hypothetical protein